MRKHFEPKVAHRSGVLPAFVSGAVATTANNTNNNRIPTPLRRALVERASVVLSTIGSDADGTILATLYKYDASAAAAVALSSALSLEAAGVATANVVVELPILSTLTDAQRLLDEGDSLYVAVVSNSAAIDTAPVGTYTVELLVKE